MADSLAPGQEVERYVVVRRIGEGGMAAVYLVRHTTLQTLHALKLLTLTGPTLQDRMVAEGRTQAMLRHANVVHVSDVFLIGGMPALVMEYVDGPDLAQWIRETEQISVAVAEQVFRGIVDGVAAAHAAGVIHRDLKPANVLLARTATGALVPKVSDFGLVKVLQSIDPQRTRAGIPMGTPQYMAPEQIRDAANVDLRADVFSLGCILYELLSRQQAYGGSDLIDIFERIADGRRAPLPPEVPHRLRVVVERCLALDRDARPAGCSEIFALLDSVTLVDDKRPAAEPGSAPLSGPPLSGPIVSTAALALASFGSAVTLLLLTMMIVVVGRLTAGAAAPGPCPTEGGVLGFARAPAVFEKDVGSTWVVAEETPVVEVAGDDEVRCLLPPGARVVLTEVPVSEAGGVWVAVDADQLVYGPEEIPVEVEPDEVVGDTCEGDPGEQLGWFFTKPSGLSSPKAGRVWRVSTAKQVVADYPRTENRNTPGVVVCAIPPGGSVLVGGDPIRLGLGKGWWVPVYGGSVE